MSSSSINCRCNSKGGRRGCINTNTSIIGSINTSPFFSNNIITQFQIASQLQLFESSILENILISAIINDSIQSQPSVKGIIQVYSNITCINDLFPYIDIDNISPSDILNWNAKTIGSKITVLVGSNTNWEITSENSTDNHKIPWPDGNGNIILKYDGHGSGAVTISSDTDNLGEDRSQVLIFKTLNSKAITTITITQPTGMQILITSTNEILTDSEGKILRVYPPGYAPIR